MQNASLGTPANYTDAAVACCSRDLDPLVCELCVGVGPLTWVDPMLEELVVSLGVSAVGALASECPPTQSAASLEAPVHEQPQVTPLGGIAKHRG